MHAIRAIFVATLACLGAAACIPQVKVAPTAVVQPGGDGYFVMGASPDNYVYWVGPGEIVDGEFRQDSEVALLPPAMWKSGGVGYPEHGYLVAKATGGTTLAVTGVQYENRLGLPGPLMTACTTFVFTVPPGQVVYVGHLTFTARGTVSAGRRTVNFEAAKAFVAEHYPRLAERLIEGTARLMKAGNCGALR